MRSCLIPWERPAGLDTGALLTSCLRGLLDRVDEVLRHRALYENAQEAVVIASKSGTLTQEHRDEVARWEVQLAAELALLVDARARFARAEELHCGKEGA